MKIFCLNLINLFFSDADLTVSTFMEKETSETTLELIFLIGRLKIDSILSNHID